MLFASVETVKGTDLGRRHIPAWLLHVLRAARLIGYRETGPVPLARQISRQSRGRWLTVVTFCTIGLGSAVAALVLDNFSVWVVGASAVITGIVIRFTPTGSMHPGWFHVLPVLIAAHVAAGVAALGPQGGVVSGIFIFLGPTIAFVIHGRRAQAIHAGVASILVLLPILTGTGSPATTLAAGLTLTAMWGLGGFVVLVWGTAEAQSELLEDLVRRDPLTGVGNRRLLHERLEYEISRHGRSGRRLTVIVLDLNGFKHVNDVLGHTAGDQLLRDVGVALQGAVRRQDTVGRPGGDEFCVLAPETGPRDAARMVENLRHALAEVAAGGRPLTAAIGVATFPDDAREGQRLTELADQRQREDKLRAGVGVDRELLPGLPVEPRHAQVASLSAAALNHSESVSMPSAESDHVRLSRRVSRKREVRYATTLVFLCGGLFGPVGALLLNDTGVLHAGLVAAIVGLAILLVPNDRMDARYFHLLPVIVSATTALVVASVQPYGYAALGLFFFTGAAIGFMMETTRAVVAHLVLATGFLILPLFMDPGNEATAVGCLCGVACLWGMAAFVRLTWEVAEEQAEHLGSLMRSDPLTGVGNRRLLEERMDYELARHARTGKQLALIVLDLNGFKQINDTLGHLAGDEVLTSAAAALRAAVRRQDTVARQGGDEFCVLAPETGPEEAARIASHIREALSGVDAGTRNLSGAVGVAVYPDDGTAAAAIVEVADARQRADKAGRIVSFTHDARLPSRR